MANLVTQSLKILNGAVQAVGKDYLSNTITFYNDAKSVKNTLLNASTDAADTFAKIKKTNITKAISDWFYQEETSSDMDINGASDEFDAGFEVASSKDRKLDGDSDKPVGLTVDSMMNISNKQTNTMLKIGRRQTEQSVANTAEIISVLNNRSSEMITSLNNINKTLLGISSRLDKVIELQAVPLTNQKEIDKGGLYQDGNLSLMRIFEQTKQNLTQSGPLSLLTAGLDQLRTGGLTPTALASVGIGALAKKIQVNGKSFDDWGKAFNEMVGTATQTAMNEMINSKFFKEKIGNITSMPADMDYQTIVPNSYDTKRAVFDGMTRMSIVNIIPQMLANINESISGQKYSIDGRGRWIAGPMKNEFNEVTRASFANSGVNDNAMSRISNAGVQSIGKQIPQKDIEMAAKALTMAIVMDQHAKGQRAFTITQLKGDITNYVTNACQVLVLTGNSDPTYWAKVCQCIAIQLSSGMMDAAGFVRNINDSLQTMISKATEFTQTGKDNTVQAGNLSFNIAANQFLEQYAPQATKDQIIAKNNSGTMVDGNNIKIDPHNKLGKYTINQYIGGIFQLLNRGINVRVLKGHKPFEQIKLDDVRPDINPFVNDDTFGEMIKGALTGNEDAVKNAVREELIGDGGNKKGFFGQILDNPAMLLNSFSHFFSSTGTGSRLQGLKDKAKNFIGEERYDAIAGKLNDVKDKVFSDERFQNLKNKVQETGSDLLEKAKNKTSNIRNDLAYYKDSAQMKLNNQILSHHVSSDEYDKLRVSTIRGFIESGEIDEAKHIANELEDKELRKSAFSLLKIVEKRKQGEDALKNGGSAWNVEQGAALSKNINASQSFANSLIDIDSIDINQIESTGYFKNLSAKKDDNERSLLGKILGVVGGIAKGVAKLAVSGSIDIAAGLKSIAQGMFGYRETDEETGESEFNAGIVGTLAVKPVLGIAKGVGKGAKAVGSGITTVVKKLFSGSGTFTKMIKSAFKGLTDGISNLTSKFSGWAKGKLSGVKDSKAVKWISNTKFMKGFTSGFKDAKAAREKLLGEKKREDAREENPLQADQLDIMEGKKESVFSKLLESVNSIFTSVKNQEEIAMEGREKREDNTPESSTNIGDVNEVVTTDIQMPSSGGASEEGDSEGGGFLSGLAGKGLKTITDMLGSFGKILGGGFLTLKGILKTVLSVVGTLEALGELKDMVSNILVDGLQPLNEIFEQLQVVIKPIVNTLTEMVTVVADTVVAIAKSLIDIIQPIVEAIKPIIQTIFELLNPILDIISGMMDFVMVPLRIAMDIITPVIEGIGYTLQVVSGVLQIGLGAIMGLLGVLVKGVGGILSWMPGSVGDSGDQLAEVGENMLEMSKNMLKAGAEQIKQGLSGMVSLIQRLIPGGSDGKKEETTEESDNKPTAKLTNDFASGDVPSITNNYTYTYGSGNVTTMNQHTYGGYMNMSERGCGPVALADAYGRRTGTSVNPASLAASMHGAGTYDTRRGTSVGSMIDTAAAMGMGMRAGGVTAASLRQASPTNPITVMGSGQGFGTRNGNNHYVNVVGTDKFGGAYVANPMTGQIGRQSINNIVLNSKLGLYGSGDENDYAEYGFSDAANESLKRLKEITGRLTSMFTGESDAERKINEASAEQKAKDIKRTLGDDYEAIEKQAIAELKSRYPELDDSAIQKKLNSYEGWKLISQLGGNSAVEKVTDIAGLINTGASDVLTNYDSINDKVKAMVVTNRGSDSSINSITGAEMTPFSPINFIRPYLDKESVTFDDGTVMQAAQGIGARDSYGKQTIGYYGSPVHDFFNSELVKSVSGHDNLVYTSDGWFNKFYGPHSEEGIGSTGKAHEGVLLHSLKKDSIVLPAITGGTVTYVTKDKEGDDLGLGNSVKWRDTGGMYHWYMHMLSIPNNIKEGVDLEPGQTVGMMGNSGAGKEFSHPVMRYVVTTSGPQGSTGDVGYINPFTYWVFKSRSDELFGDTEKEQIFNYLTDHFGFSTEAAAGIMGVLQCEGSNHALKLEGIYGNEKTDDEKALRHSKSYDTWDEYARNILFPMYDREGVNYYAPNYVSDGKYLPGIGIAQWTAGRTRQLREYAKSQGTEWYDLQTQLDFIENESAKQEVFKQMVNQLKGATDPTKAADIWMTQYEAGGYGSDPYTTWLADSSGAIPARRDAAKKIYQEALTNFVTKNRSSETTTGTNMSGKFIGSMTNPSAFATGEGYFSSNGGAVLADYGVPTITATNITSSTSGNSPLHEFFSKTAGGSAVSGNGNWFFLGDDPNNQGVGRSGRDHGGVDFYWTDGKTEGKRAMATTGGVVDSVEEGVGTGNNVRWLDDAGYLHWYMHLKDKPLVNKDDVIQPGQLLGYVGNTGDSKGAHLHYSIIDAAKFNGWSNSPGSVNPLMYFGNYNEAGPQTNKNARGGLTYYTGQAGVTPQTIATDISGSAINAITQITNAITGSNATSKQKQAALNDLEKALNASDEAEFKSTWTGALLTSDEGWNALNITHWLHEANQQTLNKSASSIIEKAKKKSVTDDWDWDNDETYNPSFTGWLKSDGWGQEYKAGWKSLISLFAGGDTPIETSNIVPPLDLSKLTDEDSYKNLQAFQQYVNKYDIKSDDSKTTDMLERMGSMTFNVRAKRVEELLEILIAKVDGSGTPDNLPLPTLFNEGIPEAVTKLSMG